MASKSSQITDPAGKEVLEANYAQDRKWAMIPVFCTARIPNEVARDSSALQAVADTAQTLDHLLEENILSSNKDSYTIRLLDTMEPGALAAITQPSRAPMPDNFASPFLDMTQEQVCDVFVEHVIQLEPFAKSVFIILDERTLRDGACLAVDVVCAHKPDRDVRTQRADFFAVREVVECADLGAWRLGDDGDPERVLTSKNIVIGPQEDGGWITRI